MFFWKLQFPQPQASCYNKRFCKRPRQRELTASVASEKNRLLNIIDLMTEVHYFFYTGEEVNVLLADTNDRPQNPVFNLQAASGGPVATYGKGYVLLTRVYANSFTEFSSHQTFLCWSQDNNILS